MITPLTTAQLAELVTGHMAEHQLPEPASLVLTVSALDRQDARVQLGTEGLAGTAAGLLAWAATQAAVSLQAWRPPDGKTVHLDLHTTLTSAHGAMSMTVYGGVAFDPVTFPGLEPGQKRPVSLGQLTTWANGADTGVAA